MRWTYQTNSFFAQSSSSTVCLILCLVLSNSGLHPPNSAVLRGSVHAVLNRGILKVRALEPDTLWM